MDSDLVFTNPLEETESGVKVKSKKWLNRVIV